jgi:hypothetical protein
LKADDDRRRRWLASDGTYFLAESVQRPDDVSGAVEAVDQIVGLTLGDYVANHAGSVQMMGAVPVAGAAEARAAKVTFTSVGGEALESLVLVAAASEGDVRVLHVVWPAEAPEEWLQAAVAIGQTASLVG